MFSSVKITTTLALLHTSLILLNTYSFLSLLRSGHSIFIVLPILGIFVSLMGLKLNFGSWRLKL